MLMNQTKTYIALLRGINVGGHHKVPMADLRKEFKKLGSKKVETVLNSGNIIFDFNHDKAEHIENIISGQLKKTFGFTIPVVIRRSENFIELFSSKPFKSVGMTPETRLYATFLKNDNDIDISLPWCTPDNSYTIVERNNNTIMSVLDLSLSQTTKAMATLESVFGKDITTRNWNTIERIYKKLEICS